MIKKKLIALNTALILGLGSVATAPAAFAQTNSSQIKQVEQSLSQTRSKLAKLEEQVKRVDKAITDNNKQIKETEENIAVTKQEITKLEKEISILNEKIAKRTEILKKRVLSLQESGGNVAYIDVLFGSKDFTDFVDRLFAVVQIANADTDLINEQKEDKDKLVEKQASVDKKLADLNTMKTELEGMKAQILEQKAENDKLKRQLKQQEKEDLTKKSNLEEEARRAQIQQASPQISRGSVAVHNSNQTSNNLASKPVVNNYSGNLNDVITAGYKYIGRSAYKFGGGRTQSDINSGLFDCSGFVSWAFRQAGISVPASTDALRYAGTRVSVSEMRPGDLVFFNTYKTDGHVGIYLGGGKFIGSQSSTGVAIANMSSGYWKNHFNGRVVRIK